MNFVIFAIVQIKVTVHVYKNVIVKISLTICTCVVVFSIVEIKFTVHARAPE